jgi:hypothetical protein
MPLHHHRPHPLGFDDPGPIAQHRRSDSRSRTGRLQIHQPVASPSGHDHRGSAVDENRDWNG